MPTAIPGTKSDSNLLTLDLFLLGFPLLSQLFPEPVLLLLMLSLRQEARIHIWILP